MHHEFTGEATDHYLECAACGVQAEPHVASWLTTPCPSRACESPVNDAGCVFVLEDGRAVCSYCDRDGGQEDMSDADNEWFASLLDTLDDDLDDPDDDLVTGVTRFY